MAPPADKDMFLLFLQGHVSKLRVEHEDLVSRESLYRKLRYTASADAMKVKVAVAFREFQSASRRLASYMSRKQRGFHGES